MSPDAEHRTVLVVDVEKFSSRANPHQSEVRAGMYQALQYALGPLWSACTKEDRGDGVFVLAPVHVGKHHFIERVPGLLAQALARHNDTCAPQARIRMRMALHAGEVLTDDNGATGEAVNDAFRLLDAASLKNALADSAGVLAVITSDWFFHDVVLHSRHIDAATFRQGTVRVKETDTVGWICRPDDPYPSDPDVLRGDLRPFPGLLAFQADQAAWFFGRDDDTSILLDKVEHMSPVLLTGPSGVGKSSLLRAGLVARLRGRRRCLVFTPTASPCAVLARQIAGTGDGEGVLAEIRADPGAAGRLLPADTLLVVDQFEEVFTLCGDQDDRESFIAALAATRCVLGVRGDFYNHCMEDPVLSRFLPVQQFNLTAMAPAQLRDAIEQPVRRAGARVQPGLVEVMIGEIGTDAGRLPLLAHALAVTWQQRGDTNELALADYDRTGRIAGAITVTAEGVYARCSTVEQQAILRDILLYLIVVKLGSEPARRQAHHAELVGAFEDEDAARAVLDWLVDARLITTGEKTVEITHDALLWSWQRLVDWITEDRAGQLVRQQLIEAAELWDNEKRPTGSLYRGARLTVAREWRSSTGQRSSLTALAEEFLAASVERAEHDRRVARNRTRRLVILSASLAMVLVVAAGALIYALQNADEAAAQRARQAGSAAARLRESNPALAAQVAVAAYDLSPVDEARSSLLSTFGTPYSTRLTGHSGVVDTVAFSRTTGLMVSGGADSAVILWNVRDWHRPSRVSTLPGHNKSVLSAAFSPDDRTLVTGSEDHTVRLWDITDPRAPRPRGHRGNDGNVTVTAFDKSGTRLLTAGTDMKVKLWDVNDLDDPKLLEVKDGHTKQIQSGAFSPDGHTIVTGAEDNTVRIWSSDSLSPLKVHNAGGAGVRELAYSPDGKLLATGDLDTNTRLWDVSNPVNPVLLGSMGENLRFVVSLGFHPTRPLLLVGNADNVLKLWDIGNPRAPRQLSALPGHTGSVNSVAFSPSGEFVATASADRTVRLWDLSGPVLEEHGSGVESVRFAPKGRTFVTASVDSTAKLWDAGDPAHPKLLSTMRGHEGWVAVSAFNHDGTVVATGSKDRTVRLWDVRDPRAPRESHKLPGHAGTVEAVAFSSDGKLLASGSADRTIRLHDVSDPEHPRFLGELTGHEYTVFALAFSPDSRLLASGSEDHTVKLWDITAVNVRDISRPQLPVVLSTTRDHTDNVGSVVFTPDGKTLISAGDDATAMLWDVTAPRSPRPVATITGHVNDIREAVVSPDAHTLAIVGTNRTATLWDITDRNSPQRLAALTGHAGVVTSAAFSPDGSVLATGSQDSSARVWDLDPDRVKRRVCAVAIPPITQAEWLANIKGVEYSPPCG